MVSKLLIDATRAEETRVAVVDSENKLIEFDAESNSVKCVKNNVYLAKVTRVEPSLQAAFVEYGGGKHGFLPFSEIHFNYYQIPTEDKEKLAEILKFINSGKNFANNSKEPSDCANLKEPVAKEQVADFEGSIGGSINKANEINEEKGGKNEQEGLDYLYKDLLGRIEKNKFAGFSTYPNFLPKAGAEKPLEPETEGEYVASEYFSFYKKYQIHEVIKRGQIVLVQVTKEERGNKGVTLSTYISLAGQYSVFLPNTIRNASGISKKATDVERSHLKNIMAKLHVPDGCSLILRTAGIEKTEAEIEQDFNNTLAIWNNITEKTLSSEAPCLIYEEAGLVKKSLRDMFRGNIKQIIIEGKEQYEEAKTLLAGNEEALGYIAEHKENSSLFEYYQVEEQLDKLYEQVAILPSGGYLVFSPTEALVAVDVNSGKATQERNIEDTALLTNIEAARELARQIRLRDLAGLLVVDFIDMSSYRNRRRVESTLREALLYDRAMVQVGRISNFGLLEMSRQRLRSSITENATVKCKHCNGFGVVASPETISLKFLRAIEREASRLGLFGAKEKASKEKASKEKRLKINFQTSEENASYMLSNKSQEIKMIEEKYLCNISICASSDIVDNRFHFGNNVVKNSAKNFANSANKSPVKRVKENLQNTSDYEAKGNSNLQKKQARKSTNRPKGAKNTIFGKAIQNDTKQGDNIGNISGISANKAKKHDAMTNNNSSNTRDNSSNIEEKPSNKKERSALLNFWKKLAK